MHLYRIGYVSEDKHVIEIIGHDRQMSQNDFEFLVFETMRGILTDIVGDEDVEPSNEQIPEYFPDIVHKTVFLLKRDFGFKVVVFEGSFMPFADRHLFTDEPEHNMRPIKDPLLHRFRNFLNGRGPSPFNLMKELEAKYAKED